MFSRKTDVKNEETDIGRGKLWKEYDYKDQLR